MTHRTCIAIGVSALLLTLSPLGEAYAASVSVTNLTPGSTVVANSNISFQIAPAGFTSPMYHLSDSFANSTASPNNIEPGGRFTWTPVASDAGTHVLALTVTDNDGNTAAISQTVVVLPLPSILVSPPSPGRTVMPGTKLTFTVASSGFTNPTFTVSDLSSYSLITSSNIDSAGNFSWTPTVSEDGDHDITVYVSDATGHYASSRVSVHVGLGPMLVVTSATSATSNKPGQLVSLIVAPSNFSPTGFGVGDSFPGSSVSNSNINLSGQFSWVPSPADVGTHVLTFTGTVGAFGAQASTTQTLTIVGPDGTPASAAAPVTVANTEGSLDALKAKLALVQSAIAAQSGSVSTGAQKFTTYLHPGSTGEDVMRLQNILLQLGFFSATPNGLYGPVTVDAVAEFQAAHGLNQLGVVGPATRIALNALSSDATAPATPASTSSSQPGYTFEHFMGVGDDDPDVLELQKRLITLGYLSGDASGYYGTLTELAVKKFQKAQGLTITGFVGRDTRTAFNK